MQLEALPINLMHPRKVRKYINSNVCLSLRHSDTVPGLIWYPKMVYFFLKFGSIFGKKRHCIGHKGIRSAIVGSSNHEIYLRKVGKHSSSNGCLYSCLSVTFPGLIRCSKLVIWGQMFEFVLIKRCCIDHHKGIRYAIKGYLDTAHIPKEG